MTRPRGTCGACGLRGLRPPRPRLGRRRPSTPRAGRRRRTSRGPGFTGRCPPGPARRRQRRSGVFCAVPASQPGGRGAGPANRYGSVLRGSCVCSYVCVCLFFCEAGGRAVLNQPSAPGGREAPIAGRPLAHSFLASQRRLSPFPAEQRPACVPFIEAPTMAFGFPVCSPGRGGAAGPRRAAGRARGTRALRQLPVVKGLARYSRAPRRTPGAQQRPRRAWRGRAGERALWQSLEQGKQQLAEVVQKRVAQIRDFGIQL